MLDHDESLRNALPWLMNVVPHARAHGLWVLDGVWNAFHDMAGYKDEAAQGRDMRFDGKTLIHPSQVRVAKELFAPSAESVEGIEMAFVVP